MTLKTNKLRDAITFALAVGATAVVGTGAAFAQETETDTGAQEATTLDRIEVTGSRIKTVDIATPQPIFSVSREEIEAQGLTSIGDVIQNLTANGSALNSTFNNGGNGETRVSLRNLGSGRTLVLVNGKRWVGGTGLGGAVDLNTIPTAAVERIEVLKGGASSIYGSDAIAGVVNVILRQNFEGAEANAYIGQFDQGDGTRQSYDFTIGASGDRFSAMLGFGYVEEDPIFAGDRYISKEPVYKAGPIFFSSTSASGNFSLGTANGTCVDADGDAARCKPDGTLGNFSYAPGQDGADWRPYLQSRDGYNFAPLNYLLTPQERRSVFGNASFDITDDVRFNTTITYNERVSEQFLAPMPIVLGVPVGGDLFISEDSIYNPFGQPVDWIQRRAVESGGRSFNQRVTTFVTDFNFQGTFTPGDKYYDWEVGYTRGQNQNNGTTFGLFNTTALRAALGPSFIDADGIARCGVPGDTVDDCVPINLLGAPGSITPEMLAYSSFVAKEEQQYTMQNYYANISGEVFELPAGMMGFAFGVTHRTESGYDQPDALVASGSTTGNAREPTRGGYKVDEAFLELAIPVLSDLPFAQSLDFSVSTRYSDYSNFGETLNSSFGFTWKPVDDLLARGSYSEGFRAPSISELFSGQSDNFPTFGDPCNSTNFGTLNPVQQQTCIAQGVPDGGYDQPNAQIRITVGGNPNLQPETATTKTLGLVYSPSFATGLDMSLDWWEIEIEQAITTLGPAFIIEQCLQSGGTGPTCALYSRNVLGGIDDLLDVNTNIGGRRVEGYDFTVNYRMPETRYGQFQFTWDSTYTSEDVFDVDGDGVLGEDELLEPAIGEEFFYDEGGNTVGEYANQDNAWRIRSNLMTRWELGDFGASWYIRYYDDQEEDCQSFENYGLGELCTDLDRNVSVPTDSLTNPNGVWDGAGVNGDFLDVVPAAQHHIGSTTYHDVSAYWNAPWNATITLGVNNVFDKNPPVAFNSFANSFDPQYEVPGRFYYMRYSQSF